MSTVNLLPKDYLQRRWQNRANFLCIILFGVVMAGVGAAALVSEQSMRHTRQVRDKVNASYAEAARLLTQMQELENTKRQMINKAEAAASLLERVPRSYLLATMAQALPENCSLVRVELKPVPANRIRTKSKGSKFDAVKSKQHTEPTTPTAPPMMLEAIGLAATDVQVANFIKNLQGHPLMTSVNLKFSQDMTPKAKDRDKDDPDSRVREFKVTIELRPNVDVIDLLEGDSGSKTAEAARTEVVEGAES